MTKKRILSLFMALVMVFSLIPNAVLADVIKDGEKSYDVYTFSVDGVKVQEQTVKVGDTLLEPAAPEEAGYEFTGWYNGGSRFTGFGSVTSVAGTTINLEAKFSEAHYVFFLDDTGRVYTTKQGVTGKVIDADVEFPTEVNESIVGWYTDPALTQKVTSVTLADENIILYAKVAKGNYLTFDSTGGSYVEPQFVAQGANTAAPANPTRLGYTFSHWSETEGGSAFTFGSTITENKTLYAVWTASTNTKYTVIHWQENIDDENYSYKESETKTGTSGAQSAASAKSYSGFTAQAITQETIAGDGSTIVNVYYDRNEYTVYFYGEECPIEAHSHDDCTLSCTTAEHQHSHNECCTKTGFLHTCNTSKCPYNGATHTHGDSCYACGKTAHTHSRYCDEETVVLHSITAKHGAYIGDQWPGSTWRVNSYGDTAQSNLLYMPLGGEDFYDYERSSGSESATYYTEVLDTVTSGGTVVGGVRYAVHHVDTAAGTGWTVTDEERYAIDGFTYVSGTSNGRSYNGAKFYYTRNDYQIIFMSGGAVANTITKQYQADISSVSYTPTRPANVPEGYVFVGWCSDAAGNAPYTFSGTMPSQNITVYAKWAAPVFDATFYVDVNGTVVKVPYAEAIDKAQIPEVEIPAGYEFIGWTTTKNDLSTLFNLDTRLYGDISLYPYFISTASFSVTYDLNGGSGSVSDSKFYAQDSHADVQSAAGISKANKVFLGWSYGGEIYYPGDKVLMPAANITLTAVWGDVLSTTSLTYKANGGVGEDEVISDLENNELLEAIANPFTREGYTFLGWAKDAGAKAPQFKAGDKIRVDNGANVLYAVWQIDQYEVSYAYTGTVPAGAPALPDTAKHDYKSTVTVAAEPTLDGYVFNGWYKDGAEVTAFSMPAKNVELTGEWSIRTDLSYTVNYYWNGTKEEVAPSKVVGGRTFNETYTENPIPIDGCTAVSQTPQSVTITTGENVINFYYYKNVALKANSKTEVYDGSEKSVSGFTGAPTGADFSAITVGAKGTVVGEYPAEFAKGTVGTVGTVDGIAKYIVTEATNGKLTITPYTDEVVVTITENSGKYTYDGTEKTVTGYKVTNISNDLYKVADFTFSGNATVKGTYVGTYNMELKPADFKNISKNFTNVKFEIVDGTLVINPIADEIVITADSNEKVYDGTALTDDGYTFTQDVLAEGDVLTAVVEGTITNVGEAANVVTSYVVMRGETDVTANYTFGESVDGKLTITKRPVTLTSASDSKVYDGTALTNSKVTDEGFVDGEGATYDVTGSQTYVGTSDNDFTYTLNEGTSADNYDITVVEGELTVTAIATEIVITAASDTKVYDGTALTDDGYTYAEELLAEGDVIVAVVEGTITDVGSADNVVTSYKVMRGETDVTENYTGITTAKGTLTITKRPVTITSPDAEKVYDGTALVNTNVTSEGFVEGEGASYIVTGSQLNVGSSVNEFTYTLNEGTKADNYTVTVVKGTLTVTPVTDKVTVTITEHSGEEVYDGTEKTVEGYDVAIDNTLYTENDFAFEGNDSVSGIYAGTYDMELKPENFTNTSDNFTNVEFVIVDGALVIKPVETEIVITADSNEKVYGGTALTDDGYTYDQSLLVEGDYIVAVVEGSQTNVGSSANKVTSYQILRGTNAAREIVDVTDCYANVTTVDGTLTVTKRPVVLTSGSDSKVYDGTALTKEVVTVSGDGWAAGEGAAYSEFASITNVGFVNNSFTYTLNEGTNAANYDITVVEGVLTVNKYTDAKLEATGYTGVYDGQLHDGVTDKAVVNGIESDEWTYTYSIDGENFAAEMPQYQDVGTYTVYVKATNANYEGDALTTTVPVVITPATIVVTADDHVIATGDPDPELTYQVSTPVETETPAFDGILVRQEGAAKGEYPIEQGTLVLVDGEGFKASNYVLEYVPGTLTILQRAIDVEKTVDVDKAFVGDTITYTFVVTNTGEVDLQNVVLIDEMLEIAGEIGALAIGETWTGELTYVATKEDVGQTLYNTVIVLAEGDTYDEDTSEGTTVYEPVPDTGDHTPVAALSAAMLVSLAGVIVLLRKQRKESAE